MESEMEETPTNAGQDEEIINSVASASSCDGHQNISPQACEQSSSATSASSGKSNSSNEQPANGESLKGIYFKGQ